MREAWTHRSRVAVLCVAVAALVWTGALELNVDRAGAATSKRGGTITDFVSAEPRSLDPASAQTQTTAEGQQLGAVYDRLVMVINGKVVPRLAESVTPSKSLTAWAIKLRPGVKFTDGTALDAAAVKFNWDRHASTATSLCRPQLDLFQSWAVKDANTLEVTLKVPIGDPFYGLLQGCLGVIASPAAIQAAGSKYGSSPETTVGAGPFVLEEWVRGDHMTFARNPSYWNKPLPNLDSITIKTVADSTQRANGLQAGQGQLAYFSIVETPIKQLEDAGFTCQAVAQYGGTGVGFNVTRAPFDDVRMRRAFALATDMKDLSEKVTAGYAQPVTTLFPKGSPFYDKSLAQKTDDLAAAQKLVDAYVADKGAPKPIDFVMATGFRAFGLVLAQQWARLKGVNVTVNEVPSGVAGTATINGNFDIAAVGLQGVDPDDGGNSSLYSRMRTGSSGNVTRFSDPNVDSLLDHARGTTDDAVRKADYAKVVRTLFDQVPMIPVYRVFQPTCRAANGGALALYDTGNVDFASLSASK
jgi:ABC-type transport system substrate-binding protein